MCKAFLDGRTEVPIPAIYMEKPPATISKIKTKQSITQDALYYYELQKSVESLFQLLESDDDSRIIQTMLDFFNQTGALPNVQIAKTYLVSICLQIYNICCKRSGRAEVEPDIVGIYDSIQNCRTRDECIARAKELSISTYLSAKSSLFPYTPLVSSVVGYLGENYEKKISLQDLAKQFNVSSSHLCRVLKKETGKTFVNLFNGIKIDHAQQLLHEGNMKVYEVSLAVGIDNYTYFYQLYRKITGKAPTEN